MVLLKWYSIIVISIFLFTGLKARQDGEVPKGFFALMFITLAPIIFYLFTT